MGLEKIYQLTTSGGWRLRLELKAKNGTNDLWSDREYDTFLIDSETNGYALHIAMKGFGTEGDVLNVAGGNCQNGMKFSTIDRDNDNLSGSCASNHKEGFWYNACYAVNFRYVQNPANKPIIKLLADRMMMKLSN